MPQKCWRLIIQKVLIQIPFSKSENFKMDNYKENLNQYDVLFLDVAWFISIASSIENTVSEMQDSIIEELKSAFPDIIGPSVHSLPVALLKVSAATGRKFLLLLMNGMPCFVKLQMMKKIQKSYIQLLRALFKGLQVTQFLAGAYMTGILPIKIWNTISFDRFS